MAAQAPQPEPSADLWMSQGAYLQRYTLGRKVANTAFVMSVLGMGALAAGSTWDRPVMMNTGAVMMASSVPLLWVGVRINWKALTLGEHEEPPSFGLGWASLGCLGASALYGATGRYGGMAGFAVLSMGFAGVQYKRNHMHYQSNALDRLSLAPTAGREHLGLVAVGTF